MVLNYIWIAFFVIAFVVALVRLVFWALPFRQDGCGSDPWHSE